MATKSVKADLKLAATRTLDYQMNTYPHNFTVCRLDIDYQIQIEEAYNEYNTACDAAEKIMLKKVAAIVKKAKATKPAHPKKK